MTELLFPLKVVRDRESDNMINTGKLIGRLLYNILQFLAAFWTMLTMVAGRGCERSTVIKCSLPVTSWPLCREQCTVKMDTFSSVKQFPSGAECGCSLNSPQGRSTSKA